MSQKRDRERVVEYLIEVGMILNSVNAVNAFMPLGKVSVIKKLLAYSSAAAAGLYLGGKTALFANAFIDEIGGSFAKNYNHYNVEETDSEKEANNEQMV